MNDEVENFVSKAKNSPNEVVLWDKLSSRIVFEDFHRYKSYIFLKFFFVASWYEVSERSDLRNFFLRILHVIELQYVTFSSVEL